MRELAAGKLTADQLAMSYQGWRQYASKGDTHDLIRNMDDYLNGMLAPIGYSMRMEYRGRDRKRNRKKWRVVIEPLPDDNKGVNT